MEKGSVKGKSLFWEESADLVLVSPASQASALWGPQSLHTSHEEAGSAHRMTEGFVILQGRFGIAQGERCKMRLSSVYNVHKGLPDTLS